MCIRDSPKGYFLIKIDRSKKIIRVAYCKFSKLGNDPIHDMVAEITGNTAIEIINSLVPRLRKLATVDLPNRSSNQIIIEVSGIDPMLLKSYASTGIDLISTSAPITKSNWVDFSMRFTNPSEET